MGKNKNSSGAGKGDKNRVKNFKKYKDNFDKITWAKKEFVKNKKNDSSSL